MNVKALHGDMTQGSRDGVMISFKGGRVPILVATDVAARGLDISTVTHIVNFDVPTSPDVYVHRIGRTGRVGRSGPRDHVRRAAPARATSRRSSATPSTTISPWSEGAHVAPATVAEPPAPPPQAARRARRPTARGYTKLIANAAAAPRASAEADLIAAVAAGGGLDGEAIRNVRVLERFALLEVPAAEAARVVEARRRHRRSTASTLALEPIRGGQS